MVDNDEDIEINEPPLDDDDSPEWGPTMTVGNNIYNVSLFWQPLQDTENPMVEIKETAESVLEGADLYCTRTGNASQYGLGLSEKGHKPNLPVAATSLADAFSDRSSTVAVFKVPEGWWFIAIRNDLILSEEDVLYLKEEDAKNAFFSMMAVPDWGIKIAPKEWGIDGTQDIDITDVFKNTRHVKLQKLGSSKGNLFTIGVIVTAVVVIALLFQLFSMFSSDKPTQVNVKARPPLVTAPILAPTKQEQVVEEPPPWESIPDPIQYMKNCSSGIAKTLGIQVPGWSFENAVCSPSGVSSSWKATIGKVAWINQTFVAQKDTSLKEFSMTPSEDGSSASIFVPSRTRTISSVPVFSIRDLKNELVDIFQGFNMQVLLTIGTEGVIVDENNPDAPAKPKYIFMNFKFNSPYDPDIWTHVISRFSGLVINKINYNTKTKIWEYEGRIYERKTTL
ncbi:MAG: Pilin accessory protein (PilO) [Firmicutes bacterium ADurb.Bin419]|nr:MAG: Pilin accessory protein (PilO) [Firmicutes bacterium ADurb.Bin419]